MPICHHCGEEIEFRYVNGRCVPIHPNGGWQCGSWASSGPSFSGIHVYSPRVWQHADFTHPTTCPECGDAVYFIRHNGGSVWVDELGWPWPKHACFDQPHTATHEFHDWSSKAARNKNPNLGVVTCIRPSQSGAAHFTEVTLGNAQKIGFFLAWMPPLESLLGALVVISREDRLLIHPDHGEIAMHDVVELSAQPSANAPIQCPRCKTWILAKNQKLHDQVNCPVPPPPN